MAREVEGAEAFVHSVVHTGPRVLHIYRTYFPETQGGVQEAVRQLCLATADHGCRNTIYSLAKNALPQVMRLPEGVLVRSRSVFEVASCDFGSPLSFVRLRALAKRADIIHCHYPWPFGDLLALLGASRTPMIVTYHSDIVRQRLLGKVYKPLQDQFFRRAAAVVATSDAYKSSSCLLQSMGEKVTTIPLALDCRKLPTPNIEREASWRAQLGQGFFLFVGVLRYYKGLHFLVEAARRTGLPVVIVGDGPERERLQSQAAGLCNVHFLGYRDDADKFALIRLARAMVFPSHLRAEAFGVSLLEASAMGRPMITTDIGTGTSLVNAHGETGLVVPPGDIEALAAAMRHLEDNPLLCDRMGEAAGKRCRRLFSADVVGAAYSKLYDRVLGEHLPSSRS
ncbi:glycosyltransferase [Uliginosibacterium aquaticum]|uniref:glycosyltransferase n=1 Tax=Uliginosibacterium aquaticum TaxID=2731212 RepID=UPI001C2CD20B|nr:glycosyltransferase [Uliginosibacterium aquaticum]